MKRDVIVSVFLFFILLALTFIFFFPVYFTYGQIMYRSVSVAERILSVVFVLLWLTLCAFTAYFKKLTYLFGGVLYSVLAYLPGIFLPGVSAGTSGPEPDLFPTLADGFFRRLYELVNAPLVGISVLFPPEKAVGLSKLMLPVLIFSYIVTQIFRFYRNAYLADQLLLNDVPQGVSPPVRREKSRDAKPRSTGIFATLLSKLPAIRDLKAADSPDEPDPGAEFLEIPAPEATEDIPEDAAEPVEVFDISLSDLEEKASNPDIKE